MADDGFTLGAAGNVLAARLPERSRRGAIRPSLVGDYSLCVYRLVRVADEKLSLDPDGPIPSRARHRHGHVAGCHTDGCLASGRRDDLAGIDDTPAAHTAPCLENIFFIENFDKETEIGRDGFFLGEFVHISFVTVVDQFFPQGPVSQQTPYRGGERIRIVLRHH